MLGYCRYRELLIPKHTKLWHLVSHFQVSNLPKIGLVFQSHAKELSSGYLTGQINIPPDLANTFLTAALASQHPP